jgi:hypothetical protein
MENDFDSLHTFIREHFKDIWSLDSCQFGAFDPTGHYYTLQKDFTILRPNDDFLVCHTYKYFHLIKHSRM